MIDNIAGVLAFLGITVIALTLGAALGWFFLIRKANAQPTIINVHSVTQRIRATGTLVGLEVAAKEIATATKGLSWMPPIVLSQAKLAMIFQFEKQYAINLASLSAVDVSRTGPSRYRLTLPPLEVKLRLVDVSPYDIQAGRVLGLLDVIPMSAERQKELMKSAQEQAGSLLESSEETYKAQARQSIEKQLRTLLGLFDQQLEICWREDDDQEQPLTIMPELHQQARKNQPANPNLALVAG